MNSIKVCEYSRSRSFHDDLILQDQASGERSQDQWSSGNYLSSDIFIFPLVITLQVILVVFFTLILFLFLTLKWRHGDQFSHSRH